MVQNYNFSPFDPPQRPGLNLPAPELAPGQGLAGGQNHSTSGRRCPDTAMYTELPSEGVFFPVNYILIVDLPVFTSIYHILVPVFTISGGQNHSTTFLPRTLSRTLTHTDPPVTEITGD